MLRLLMRSGSVPGRDRFPLLALVFATLSVSACDGGEQTAFDCEVAIVGGGVGGLHTAFRLAPSLADGVCLFEKEAPERSLKASVSQKVL